MYRDLYKVYNTYYSIQTQNVPDQPQTPVDSESVSYRKRMIPFWIASTNGTLHGISLF